MSKKFLCALVGCITLSFALTSASQASSQGGQLADWANNANKSRVAPVQAQNYMSPERNLLAKVGAYQNNSFNPYGAGLTFNPYATRSYVPNYPQSTSTLSPQYQAQAAHIQSGVPNITLYQKELFPVGQPTLKCVIEAATRQGVSADLLLAINSIERGRGGQYVSNKNGSQDIGAFQINSIHLPRAQKFNATPQDLATRGCYNAEFAAMLLREALTNSKMRDKDLFTRAAGYHSWTPQYNQIYRKKLIGYLSEWHIWLKSNNLGYLATSR